MSQAVKLNHTTLNFYIMSSFTENLHLQPANRKWRWIDFK